MYNTIHLFIWEGYNFIENYNHAHKVYKCHLQDIHWQYCLFFFFFLAAQGFMFLTKICFAVILCLSETHLLQLKTR
jgi:hypothetical protein